MGFSVRAVFPLTRITLKINGIFIVNYNPINHSRTYLVYTYGRLNKYAMLSSMTLYGIQCKSCFPSYKNHIENNMAYLL